eukprot:gene17589-7799_t
MCLHPPARTALIARRCTPFSLPLGRFGPQNVTEGYILARIPGHHALLRSRWDSVQAPLRRRLASTLRSSEAPDGGAELFELQDFVVARKIHEEGELQYGWVTQRGGAGGARRFARYARSPPPAAGWRCCVQFADGDCDTHEPAAWMRRAGAFVVGERVSAEWGEGRRKRWDPGRGSAAPAAPA